MATDRQWARAYALQALSDLRVRDRLVEAGAEKCHRLHYLQMAADPGILLVIRLIRTAAEAYSS